MARIVLAVNSPSVHLFEDAAWKVVSENSRKKPSLLGEALSASLTHADAVTEAGTVKVSAGDEAGGIEFVISNKTGAGKASEEAANIKFFHNRLVTAFTDESHAIDAA